ncbi:MAG: PDZ domain-containing protein [Ilumatobacteraceae bacterium]
MSAEEALPILTSLRQQAGGTPRQEGFLGVGLDDRTDGGLGALITDVRADTPADTAGIERDDIVIAIDGSPVEGVAGLIAAIRDLEPGDLTIVTVRRDDELIDLSVILTSRPDS